MQTISTPTSQTISVNPEKTEVQKLMDALLLGIKVDRVYAWKHLRIADLRSRISDLQRDYNLTLDMETVPGKRYRRYFFKSLV